MMLNKTFSIFILILLSGNLWADLGKVKKLYDTSSGSIVSYEAMISELVNSGYYYTAVPWLKEYIVSHSGSLGSSAENSLERIIDHTGVQLFEKLPSNFLTQSRSQFIKYILGKQSFYGKDFDKAIRYISTISSDHSSYPFSLNLKASSYYMLGKFDEALSLYKDCLSFSKNKREKNPVLVKQMDVNRETCQAGIARTYFAQKRYKEANEAYAKIPKDSYIWPDLLFEEAWNNYYLKDYNRSLGKIVTYNAPVFKDFFKPEAFSLNAVSYLKLCHYDEAQRIAESFTQKYQQPGDLLRKYILLRGDDFRYYYKLIMNFEKTSELQSELFHRVLSSIVSGPVYQELKKSLVEADLERKKMTSEKIGGFYAVLRNNIDNTIFDLQELIGEYVREELVQSYKEINRTNQGMGYIKLDILNNRKQALYGKDSSGQKGDLKNLKRTRYQYFWNFNGEFWADEIGDYVFALESRCQK